MSNLSKKKREVLLSKINKMKEGVNDDDMIATLSEIENEITRKKYGLVWEEHEEEVDVELKNKIPVFTEIKDRELGCSKESDYNFLLEGDNLHVLKLLEKTHSDEVDLIYIDPPYNTKNKEFIYNDDYISKEDGFRHSKWLSFMYKRLEIAKKLLSKSGVIFISIDENEFAQLKLLCDNIFGEDNFIECIIWNKRVPKNDKGIGNIHEYILLYSKNTQYKYKFMMEKDGLEEVFSLIQKNKSQEKSIPESEKDLKKLYKKKGLDRAITLYNNLDEKYDIWGKINVSWPNGNTFGPRYDIIHPVTKKPTKVPDRGWRWSQESFESLLDYDNVIKLHDGSYICGEIWFAKDEKTQPSRVKYLKDVDRMLLRSIISTKSSGSMELEKIFNKKSLFAYPKPCKLIKILIDSFTYDKKNALILDFFAGSGTTAQAVIELNAEDGGSRKYILVTNNENNICDEVTYRRISSLNNEGTDKKFPINMKYYKTDFIDKNSSGLVYDNLIKHVKELIQLKYHISIDNAYIKMIMTEEELDNLFKSDEIKDCKKLFMPTNVLTTSEQDEKIKKLNIEVLEIPQNYYTEELKEVHEL